MSENPTLTAALTYISRGWAVFPVKPGSKIPDTKNGVLDASKDAGQIHRWFATHPERNVAIATGRSGLVVIDLDGQEGEASWRARLGAHGPVPTTPEALTPSGGRHLLFSDDGQPVKPRTDVFGKGSAVDVRSGESYIVVAPSVFDGKRYKWAKGKTGGDIKAPSLPAWLRDALEDEPISFDDATPARADEPELVESAQDEYGARMAARMASLGMAKDEARQALATMIEKRFAGGWEGLDPRRPWTTKDIERWIEGAYAKFFDPDGGMTDAERIKELLGEAVEAAVTPKVTQGAISPTAAKPLVEGFSAADLQGQKFEPIKWVIADLLPEGASILGGKPKVGKSWLVLGLASAVASVEDYAFGEMAVSRGDVLYLALEDGKRRLQRRLRKILGDKTRWPRGLFFFTEWPRVDQGGIEAIEKWLDAHPSAQLIVIDTLKHIEAAELTKGNGGYRADYQSITPLQHLAQQRGIAILIVTHLRKLGSDDPIDMLQGTLGLSGGIDNFYVFTRTKGSAKGTLYYRGRDVDEGELALIWREGDTMLWRVDNTPPEPTPRDTTLDAIRPDEEITARELAERLGAPYDTVHQRLLRLERDGQIERVARGKYRLATVALLAI